MAYSLNWSASKMLFQESTWQVIPPFFGQYSEIHLASAKGRSRVLKNLIRSGCDIDLAIPAGFKAGCTALHIAAESEQADCVQILINSGANICLQNETGSTPLHVAYESRSGSIKLLILLKLNNYYNFANRKGLSHFHVACTTDEVDIVEKFISNGAQINSQIRQYSKYRGDSPLHFATKSGCAKTVKYLLEKGADFAVKNANNETPLHVALKKYYNKATQLILTAYYAVCSEINQSIKDALIKNKLPMDIKVNRSVQFLASFRALHFAVKFQLLDIIKILTENGIDIEAKDSNGMTALHCAIQDTQTGLLEEDYLDVSLQSLNWEDSTDFEPYTDKLVKIVDILLKAGCDVNARDNFGRTPIFYLYDRVSQRAEIKAARCLHAKNFSRERPFSHHVISSYARKNIIRMMLGASSSLDVQDNEGNTILHLLARAGNSFLKFETEIVEAYVQNGSDVNALNRAGYTALHYACGSGHGELLSLLLQYGADVNLTHSEKLERPIHRAVRYLRCSYQCHGRSRHKFELVEKLLKHGAHIDAKTTNGMTPILIATNSLITSGTINNLLIMCLLTWGCDLNCADSVGRTPLHYICKHKNLPMLELFLKHGADVNALDQHGNTPFTIVRKSNRFSLVDSLILFSYLKRLTILGMPLCFANRKLYGLHNSVVNLCDGVKQKFGEIITDEQCRIQLEYMKTVHVDSYTTLYDILRKSTSSLIHHVRNEKLLNIFWDPHFDDDYSIYGYLVKVKMNNAKKRAVLLKPAKESLASILKFNMPDSCFHTILLHLKDNDLKTLIAVATTSKKRKTDKTEQSAQDVKRPRLS